MRLARLLTAVVSGVCAACALVFAPTALATSLPAQITAATAAGVSYLESLQQANGSIPGFGGDWSLTALAAAGVAPGSLRIGAGDTDARTWYRDLIGDSASWPEEADAPVTEYERAALVAYAAGIDPARVSQTQNLIAQIAAQYQTANPGYYGTPGLFNGTVFALLALADAKTHKGDQRVPQVLLNESIEVIRKNQHTDGGWTYERAEGNERLIKAAAEPDMTGAAIAALCGAGVASTDPTIVKATEYLASLLVSSTGALSAEFGANTDSNAWAVQGLDACGINPQGPEFTSPAGKTPIDFLISQQLSDGAFRYQPGESSANEYSSQDAVRALAGGGFTAAPPKAKGAPRWEYEKDFDTSASVSGLVTLIVNDGTSALDVCAVKISPQATKAKLFKVLEAAESQATPVGCVTAFSPSSGKGAITSIDGQPTSPSATWELSIDDGPEKPAKATSAIHLGDTIYLRLS